MNNNGNGLLGGLFGNGGSEINDLRSENAILKAKVYTDEADLNVYTRSKTAANEYTDARFAVLAKELDLVSKYTTETTMLKDQLIDSKIAAAEGRMSAKIDGVACMATNGLTAVNGAIACLQNTVNGITKTIVPATSVCPQPMSLYNSWAAPTSGSGSASA